jgi:tight adherence protein C
MREVIAAGTACGVAAGLLAWNAAALVDIRRRSARARAIWSGPLTAGRIRASEARRTLPDLLDLVRLGLLAGLPPAQAWSRAAAFLPVGSVADHARRVALSVVFGRSFADALSGFAEALPDDDGAGAVRLIAQAVRRGHPVGEPLRRSAEALRSRLLAAAEERAQTAGLRLLVPIFVFLMPTVLIIVFGGLVLQASGGGLFF